MRKYETVGGTVTRSETYSKLMDLLREAEECCYVISHLHNTEDSAMDRTLAHGWRGVGQLLEQVRAKIIDFAARKMQ